MNKTLGSLLLCLSFLSAGSITATMDTQEVKKGDTALLTLSVVGKNIDHIPKIEDINGIKVLHSQPTTSYNYVSVNGVSSMERSYSLILEFKPDRNMTIPSFSVKVDGEMKSTEPIELTVIDSLTGTKRETESFSLDMQITKSKFYVGESILVNVLFRQKNSVNVMQVDYSPPKFKDFFSKQIGEGKTYQKGAYTIQELNYLLVAKKSGKLTLEPARAKVAQRSRQRQIGGWFADVPKWTQLSSPSLIVEVLKPTEEHDIVGNYKLTDSIDHKKVKANQPVTLHLELLGKGSLDDYDGIKFEIPSVTIYSDDSKIDSALMGKELQSRYVKSFVFIADHNFTIPSKEIRVYDYKIGKVKVLKTKKYFIEVESNAKTATALVHTQNPTSMIKSKSSEPWQEKLPSIISLILAFILGAISTLLFKYLPKISLLKWKKKATAFKGEEALKVLYPKIGESLEIEVMVRKLYALKNGDKSVQIDKQRLKELLEQYK